MTREEVAIKYAKRQIGTAEVVDLLKFKSKKQVFASMASSLLGAIRQGRILIEVKGTDDAAND